MYKYPFREVGTNTRGEASYRPVIDVEVGFESNALRTGALVDTGSPVTLFDYGTAEALLIRLRRAGAEIRTVKLLGRILDLQFEKVSIAVLGEDDDISTPWTADVGFILDPRFEMPFQGVLGVDGFMDQWAVTFNSAYGYFLLQDPRNAPDL